MDDIDDNTNADDVATNHDGGDIIGDDYEDTRNGLIVTGGIDASKEEDVDVIPRQPAVRYIYLRTAALLTTFFVMGAATSIMGPSLVSVSILMNEATATLASCLVALSIGGMVGSLVCGIIYDIINVELLFTIGIMMLGVMTVVLPSCDHLPVYVIALVVHGFFSFVVDTAGQTYVIYLWLSRGYQWSMLLVLHGIWSVGATTGPFLIRPFLVDIHGYSMLNGTTNITQDDIGYIAYQESSVNHFNHTRLLGEVVNITVDSGNDSMGYVLQRFGGIVTSSDDLKTAVSVVKYGFAVTGLTAIVPFILYLSAFILLGPSFKSKMYRSNKEHGKSSAHNLSAEQRPSKRVTIIIIILLIIFIITHGILQSTPGALLATFAVKGLDWPNNFGALVTSTYYGANILGKILLIYPIQHMTPTGLVLLQMAASVSGSLLMLLSPRHFVVLWIGAALIGLGTSSILASYFRWVDRYIAVSGRLASVVITSYSVGAMIGPAMFGYLFHIYGPIAFVYLLIACSLTQSIVFISSWIFTRKFGMERQPIVLAVYDKPGVRQT